MRSLERTIPAVALALALIHPATHAQQIKKEGESTYSIQEEEGVADAASAREQFALGEQAEQAGNVKRAIAAYRKVAKRFPKTGEAARSLFRIGSLQETNGDFDRAFEAYQKLVEDYPGTKNFDEAIASQFRIASLFLEGERQRLLGIPTLPSMERAQEMFEAVIKSAPFTKYAPLSQFNIGLAHEKQKKMPEAISAFQTVIDRYPDSDVADDAQYQIAYVWFEQSRTGSYDQTTVQKAKDAYQDFLLRYPDSEKTAQARENLKLLEGGQTKSAYEIAKFYDKSKQYKAAVIYYNDVLRQEPDSANAEEARQRIDEIRSLIGEDALQLGPERAETGETSRIRRRLQAQVDTKARPDYVGPPGPVIPDEVPPEQPRMRTSPADIGPMPPAVEPELPQ